MELLVPGRKGEKRKLGVAKFWLVCAAQGGNRAKKERGVSEHGIEEKKLEGCLGEAWEWRRGICRDKVREKKEGR